MMTGFFAGERPRYSDSLPTTSTPVSTTLTLSSLTISVAAPLAVLLGLHEAGRQLERMTLDPAELGVDVLDGGLVPAVASGKAGTPPSWLM